ncbi:DNA-binding protein [Xanthomonas sp. NCPPB 2632]|uniref:DNA-binding protein n=1 Tax=Xanthomonas sp. NCPPB 2632 TaxID=3240912 RepID=UPI003514D9A8
MVAVGSLKTDEILQPREGRMVPYREQGTVAARSDAHVGTMRLALEAGAAVELEPLLAAEVGNELLIVDGHHRLKAYSLARRAMVPVRTAKMSLHAAVILSKLANTDARAMEMHPQQRLDAAWQYLAHITERGRLRLPPGESLRAVSGRFGIGRGTVARMVEKLPSVSPSAFAPAANDLGTGFPRWRYVREHGAGWLEMEHKMTAGAIATRDAERLARKLGKLISDVRPDVLTAALRLLSAETALKNDRDTAELMAAAMDVDGADF